MTPNPFFRGLLIALPVAVVLDVLLARFVWQAIGALL